MQNETARTSKNEAYLYASGIAATTVLGVLMAHNYMFTIQRMGMAARVACCSLIYRKSLKLSRRALGDTSVGQMVNLLSNDVNRFDAVVSHIIALWLSPLILFVLLYLIYVFVGLVACAGIASYILYIPVQSR